MIRIAICDDDKIFCSELADFLRKNLSPRGKYAIDVFYDGEQLVYNYTEKRQAYDIIVLDIDMPLIDGLEAGSIIRALDGNVEIIILTGYRQYALQGYEMRPYNYLLKPVDRKNLLELFSKVENEMFERLDKYLDMEIPGSFIHVPFSNILFLESEKQKVHIHLNSRVISVYNKLSNILSLLDGRFVRSHKSYVVNLEFVEDIDRQCANITLSGYEMPIPISRRMKASFINDLKEYIYGHDHL